MAEVAENTEIEVVETTTQLPVNDAELDGAEKKDASEEEKLVDAPPAESVPTKVEITDDAVFEFLKTKGITTEGMKSIEDLKPKIEPTPEQLSAEELHKEKLLLDKHFLSGNTTENFTALKNLAKSNPVDVAIVAEREMLLESKYTTEQADKILKNKYALYTEDEIAEIEDEDEKKELLRIKELSEKQLKIVGDIYIKTATSHFDKLQELVDLDNFQKETESALVSRITEAEKTLQRTITINMDKLGEKLGLQNIEVSLSEDSIKDAVSLLKEKASRDQLFYHKDGSEKAEDYLRLLALEKSLPEMLKQAALKGGQAQAEILTKAMPDNARQLQTTPINNGSTKDGKVISKNGTVVGSMVVRN